MHIYGFLAAILGVQQTLGVQRRQCNVIYLYSTLSKFAVLLRKCCPLSKLQLSNNIFFKTFAKSISEERVSLSSFYATIY